MNDLTQQLTSLVPTHESLGAFVDDVRSVLHKWTQRGDRSALLTLVNYEGRSPRPIGSQLLVNESGEYLGLISGGCLESVLIDEALSCIQSNQQKLVRYGLNSDYLDIQLPCGSGIDVLITPNPACSWVDVLYQAYQNRQPAVWKADLGKQNYSSEIYNAGTVQEQRSTQNQQLSRSEVANELTCFTKCFQPRTRIVVVGSGAIFDYFVSMTKLFDMDLIALSTARPNPSKSISSPETHLTSASAFDPMILDEWTALIMLSHDHDWETEIFAKSLDTKAFYISALGSQQTHQQRLMRLKQEGFNDAQCGRIKGPAGLDLGGKTPPEIALSVLAELVKRTNKT